MNPSLDKVKAKTRSPIKGLATLLGTVVAFLAVLVAITIAIHFIML